MSNTGAMIRTTSISLLIGALLFGPVRSFAYSFVLTESEFRTWPSYCKVVYLRTQVGKQSGLRYLVSDSEYVSGNAVLASNPPYGEGGLHHLCAGMKWLDRARVESDPHKAELYVSRGISETQYTLERTKPGSYTFALAATQMATALHAADQDSKALELLDRAILASPQNADFYVMKALIHHKRKEYELAKNVLVEGNQSVAEASLDIHYNLGLVLVKLGDFDEAAEHAYLAYAGGYPLPGLRRQLERKGRWNPPQ